MYTLIKKLKALKPVLRVFSRENYGDIHIRLEIKKRNLHQLQLENLHSNIAATLQEEHSQSKLVYELGLAEEMFLRQKF